MDKRAIREVEYGFMPCHCAECVEDERMGFWKAASFKPRRAFSSTCKNKDNMGLRHYENMGKWLVKPGIDLSKDAIAKRRRGARFLSRPKRRDTAAAIDTTKELAASENEETIA